MRYAQIRKMDISNGEGVGIALFVQGCPFHCYNCFNPETWDFNDGKEWTEETENKFIELANRPYIKRISILGGEPLSDENLDGVLHLINKIRLSFGDTKTIWLYSGYMWEEYQPLKTTPLLDPEKFASNLQSLLKKRYEIVKQCDVLVDGRYIDSQRDISLRWCGSKNQKVIDIKETIKEGEIILWK